METDADPQPTVGRAQGILGRGGEERTTEAKGGKNTTREVTKSTNLSHRGLLVLNQQGACMKLT